MKSEIIMGKRVTFRKNKYGYVEAKIEGDAMVGGYKTKKATIKRIKTVLRHKRY